MPHLIDIARTHSSGNLSASGSCGERNYVSMSESVSWWHLAWGVNVVPTEGERESRHGRLGQE